MVSTRSGSPPVVRPLAWPLGLLALAPLLLTGCQGDEIRRYQAEQANVAPRPRGAAPETKLRLLAVIAPRGEKMWVFKFLGPLDAITEQEENFGAFVRSLRFADGGPTWKLPATWEEEGPTGPRHATLHAGTKGSAPQLTVFDLPKSPVLANINRWRTGDLGLTDLEEGDLGRVSKKRTVNGTELFLIDMTGPGPHARKAPPGKKAIRRPGGIAYTAPEGWTDTGAKRGFVEVAASFALRDETGAARVVVTPLPGHKVRLVDDVKRWRNEVGLAPLTQEELGGEVVDQVKIDTLTGRYFDFRGPKGRSLVVKLERGGVTWFFKLIGAPALVGKNKPAFEAFLRSVKFKGGRGAADE